MTRELSDMTLEELWALFPIFLTEPNPAWESWYEEERRALKTVLPDSRVKRISHVGSTAIRGIWAKPIVDILLEARVLTDLPHLSGLLQESGYTLMNTRPGRLSFNKGYTPDGFAERVFHLHLRGPGDNDELYFRDYLNSHPKTAAAYEKLKLELWPRYEHDRDGYTAQKENFVRQYTRAARELYGEKYP